MLAVADGSGRVLLVQQRGEPFRGEWLLPGGGLEAGETFEAALRREVREETGLEVEQSRLVRRYDVQTGDLHFDVCMYTGRVSGEVGVGIDGEAVGWRDVEPATAHPILLLELRDAGLMDVAPDDLRERLGRDGVQVSATEPVLPAPSDG